jgi:hypothetical protein
MMDKATRALLTKIKQTEAILALVTKIQQAGVELPRPASKMDLKRARKAQFPKELIEFYRQCEPIDCIELRQRIWSIENALVENTDAVPGCVLYPHGFVVFASNRCGDSYCIDTNVTTPKGRHPVVFFSHEMISEDATLADIQRLRLVVAESLEDFLIKFTNGTLVNDPLYG